MRIDILTLFPEYFEGPMNTSILRRAQKKELFEYHCHNIRDFSTDKHRHVDDYAFGGGAGMVMMIEPIDRCLEKLKSEREYDEIIYLSPDGELLTQALANQLSIKKNIVLLCGHYKGVDERVREHLVTREISVGDYVLTGGETAAIVLCDAIVRLVPGVLNDEQSALSDSFQDHLISPPVYTRPAEYKGWKVPEIVLSGHQAKIEAWKLEQAIERTRERRPGLLHNDSENF